MTYTTLAICATIFIIAAFGLVWYANSAGKAKAEIKAFKAQEKGRAKVNEIVKKNVANLTDTSFGEWLHSQRNQER